MTDAADGKFHLFLAMTQVRFSKFLLLIDHFEYFVFLFLRTMRLWSIHPKYLDSKGLVALWRESLLAKNVLENKTKGYKNHPQLLRFKQARDPVNCINQYLFEIYNEAKRRNYSFDKKKIKTQPGLFEL